MSSSVTHFNQFVKLHLITHNVFGLNNPKSIFKRKGIFNNTLNPQIGIVMIQEHKLKSRLLKNLGKRLMLGCAS